MTEIGPVAMGVRAAGRAARDRRPYIAEVIDPLTGQRVPRGTTGELVLTNLGRLGSPLIRYRTSDIVRAGAGRHCVCGAAISPSRAESSAAPTTC